MLRNFRPLSNWQKTGNYGRLLNERYSPVSIPSKQICLQRLLRYKAADKNNVSKKISVTSVNSNVRKELEPSDLFGTLDPSYEKVVDLDDNDGETEYLAKISDTGRPKPFDYLHRIENLLKPPNIDLKQALEILEVEMKLEYVKPIPEIYKLLIHACGNKGYCDKAFELYRQYTARRFPINHGIFSDLFNSCANCPKDEDNSIIKSRALQHAKKLYLKINANSSGHFPPVLYNNMIKAFGRCGEVEYAFDLLDKMGEKRIKVDASTINHVLHACINDKNSGLRHALMLWRKMRRFNIKPNVQSYNLLLRATKDCGIGDPQFLQDVLLEAMSSKDVRLLKKKFHNDNLIEVNQSQKLSASKSKDVNDKIRQDKSEMDEDSSNSTSLSTQWPLVSTKNSEVVLPNFLSPKPNFDSDHGIIGLSEDALKSPENKFLLFGNLTEFLNLMVTVDHIKPDIKTISQLLHCIEPKDEYLLIESIKKYKITTDIDFFNQLMRKRVARYDMALARSTLNDINDFDLAPDIATFGCLAMTCNSDKTTFKLLKDMHEYGIKPNVQIITALLRTACKRYSFKNIEVLLSILSRENIKPTIKTITTLEHYYQKCRGLIVQLDSKKELAKVDENFIGVKVLKNDINNGSNLWRRHVTIYSTWLKKTEIDYPSHPWKQFLTSKDLEKAVSGPETKKKYINQIINNS